MSNQQVIRYRVRWLFPGNGPPLSNATIEISDGVITRVSTDACDALDLGDVALLPGLINAHTHLEFSNIQAPLEPLPKFPAWIQSVIRWRNEFGAQPEAAILSGLKESQQTGVTSIAEIATTDWRKSPEILSSNSLPQTLLMFREYLGLSDAAVEPLLQDASEFLSVQSLSQFQAGLSPHATYSLHPELLQGLIRLAQLHQVPLAMHLAESPAEMELLQTGKGELAQMLIDIGVFRPEFFSVSQKPIHYLERLDCGVPVLIIHGNYLSEEELQFLAKRPQMSVVYCPRTHAAMQKDPHPWQRMEELGINVALGTDSRASNPDLSIWNELCFLKQKHPEIPSSTLLKLATSNAAQSLQLPNQGKLQAGCLANFLTVPLLDQELENPEAKLFTRRDLPFGILQRGEWLQERVRKDGIQAKGPRRV